MILFSIGVVMMAGGILSFIFPDNLDISPLLAVVMVVFGAILIYRRREYIPGFILSGFIGDDE
ncbi:hypothetical protein [Hahella sp. CCB-MM4]|uniref:hypothetical protein n=1 Tax=Hahella sp. (strain CCB-MM4) TaxID=1926491 RepID=UPI00113FDEFE|nr:hypothetical protein [Hahella sp. CCB-MM4]